MQEPDISESQKLRKSNKNVSRKKNYIDSWKSDWDHDETVINKKNLESKN